MSKFKFVLIFGFLFSIPGFTESNSTNKPNTPEIITYGDYAIKDTSTLPSNKHSIALSLGFDSGNPLQDVAHVSLSYNYFFADFLEVGLIGKVYTADKTSLLKRVESEFGLLGLNIETEQPENSLFLKMSALPLKGALNFFGISTIPYIMEIAIAPGMKKTKQNNTYYGFLWSVESRFFIKQNFAVILNYNQEAESAFTSRKTTFINQINLGVLYYIF